MSPKRHTISESWLDVKEKKSSVIRVIFSYFLVFSKEQGKNKEGGEAEKDWNGGKRGRLEMEEVEWRKYGGEPW